MAGDDYAGAAQLDDLAVRCQALFAARLGDTLVLHVRQAHQRKGRRCVVGVLETVGRSGAAWRTPRGYRLYFAWTDWWNGTVETDDAAVTVGLAAAHQDLALAAG